jgi:hypothetical protein
MTRSRDVADTQDNLGGAVAPFVAGKNKIINGDFGVNQRAFSSVTNPSSAPYSFDRWLVYAGTSGSSNAVFSNQSFTPGIAPVTGYESTNFLRVVTTSQDATNSIVFPQQRIEDVRTLAGQTVTISFWAKANSGTPKVFLELSQIFGSGGSPSSAVDVNCGQVTLSTSWARYSTTVSMPSITGKTIGTTAGTSYVSFQPWVSAGTTFNSRTGSLGAQNNTFDFWGFQIEAGNVMTPFTTASGSIGGELALCQRYYYRTVAASTNTYFATGSGYSSTIALILLYPPVPFRGRPSVLEYSTLNMTDTVTSYSITGLTFNEESINSVGLTATVSSGLTGYRPYFLKANASLNAYIGVGAEL